MLLKVYCLKDVKVGFMRPFTQVNDAVCVREFSNLINNSDTEVSQNYFDIELYRIGEFNTDTGEITSDFEYIIKGTDVKKVVADEC